MGLASVNDPSACVVFPPLQIRCSAPFGKDMPCQSCRKNGLDCVFSDRQKSGPKATGAKGVPSSPRVRSVTRGRRVDRTIEEPTRPGTGRASTWTLLTSLYKAENATSASTLDASEDLASRWTTAYWTLADHKDSTFDAEQTSVTGAKANNSSRQKELRTDMHVIGDKLTVRWVFHE
ncbi:hypothetical protein Esi_0088_0034 [Ectocarpus siliculosus]|uniref:Zn(2)-C6 fungal-type domain-containing protein n=1 Tax=Ectocarpus siliculosus TaxID=2880 RepID=D7G8B0_ECTSI|nr:hypothetical protein Esi_0088_0034 [Ectocarpus siliculosus]|eukprot:CBJ27962.1 hypothetical protein Esi_0088_0034 [Ectocarpus siliculosus]